MKRSARFVTGLVLNALLALATLPTLVAPHTGPAPVLINVLTGVLGVGTLVGVVLAWRGRPLGVVLVVVTQVLNLLSAVPAFFAGLSAGYTAFIAVGCLVTIVAVLLVLPARDARRVTSPAH